MPTVPTLSRRTIQSILAGLCVSPALAGGCSSRLPYEGPAWDPPRQASRAMELYDADGDGALGPGELERSPALAAAVARADQDGDGRLDSVELEARIDGYRGCRDFLLATVCQVTLDGRPLAGATVKFLPDEFLGTAIEPARGVTDSQGKAVMGIEGSAKSGVRPGFYRVEIVLEGADPAGPSRQQNGRSALGYDAAPDAGPEGLRPSFALDSP